MRASASVIAAPAAVSAWPKVTKAKMRTRADCELEVSIWPRFTYNAVGGGGWADVEDLGDGLLKLVFDPQLLVIPDLNYRTGSIYNVPIPPPINIAIIPRKLEGTIDRATGEVNLDLEADFFTSGFLYNAPPLVIRTTLTTGTTAGRFKLATGEKIVGSRARLVGAARVPRVADDLLNMFLFLPTDCLAIMSAEFDLIS